MNACECWLESSYIEKSIEKSAGVNQLNLLMDWFALIPRYFAHSGPDFSRVIRLHPEDTSTAIFEQQFLGYSLEDFGVQFRGG